MRTCRGLFPAVLVVTLLPLTVAAAPVVTSREAPPTVVAVSAGATASCALTSEGAVECWGERVYDIYMEPYPVRGLDSGVQEIATGWSHSCALRSSGTMKCWGDNSAGQLGDGTTKSRHDPVNVDGLDGDVIAISAAGDSTCAVTSEGGVQCWGENGYGQLGDGTTRNRHVPTDVVGLSQPVTRVASGDRSTCALLQDGSVQCWGRNNRGQLGDGTTRDRLTPTTVKGLPHRAVDVAVGPDHTCAAVRQTGVLCWGGNTRGQLGTGDRVSTTTPTSVVGLPSSARSVAAGFRFTCASTPSGPVRCWGSNDRGQLGDGTRINRSEPTPVLDLDAGVTDLAAGSQHACTVTTTGAARCWGDNFECQVGDGTYENSRPVPMTVWGFTGTGPSAFRPDIMIARHRDGPYVGNDVYSARGFDQTIEFIGRPDRIASFHILVQSDAPMDDVIYVEGHAWSHWYQTIMEPAYFTHRTEISRAVEYGYYWTRVDRAGQRHIRITVTVYPELVPRHGASFTVTSVSSHNPTRRDAVRIKVVRPE